MRFNVHRILEGGFRRSERSNSNQLQSITTQYHASFLLATMGDNATHHQPGQPVPEYIEPIRPFIEELFRALAEGQRINQDTMNGLAQAVTTLVASQSRTSSVHSSTNGPKVKEQRLTMGTEAMGSLTIISETLRIGSLSMKHEDTGQASERL